MHLSLGVFIALGVGLALLAAAPCGHALRILSPENLGRNYSTPEFHCLVAPRPTTGQIIVYNDISSMDDIRGKIVLLLPNMTGIVNLKGIPNEVAFNILAQYSPIGIVYTNPSTEHGGSSDGNIFDRNACRNLTILAVEIGLSAGVELGALVSQNPNMTVELNLGDKNLWLEIRMGAGILAFQLIFGLLVGSCAVLALANLIGWHRLGGGLKLNVGQICLVLEFLSNLFRLIYIALDPIYSGKIFSASQGHMMITISWPISIMTTLLITLYWLELLTMSKVKVPHFLNSMKWPFIAISAAILALELATSVSRALILGSVSTLTTVTGIVYAVILAATMLLFSIVGGRTLRQLNAGDKIAATSSGQSKRLLNKTTKLIIANGIFSLLWIIGVIFAAIRGIFWDYRGFYVTWSLVFTALVGMSFTKILSFMPPQFAVGGLASRSISSSSSQPAATSSGNHV